MTEIIIPVRQPERARAAMQNGADALLLPAPSLTGAGGLALRPWLDTVADCRIRGLRAIVSLPGLFTDQAIEESVPVIREALRAGVSAIMTQDVGMLRCAKALAPALPVYASDRLGIHNLEGVRSAVALGFSHVTLDRNLSQAQLAFIGKHARCGLIIMAREHTCACYAGQCRMRPDNGGCESCQASLSLQSSGGETPLSRQLHDRSSQLKELSALGITDAIWESPPYTGMPGIERQRVKVRFACLLQRGAPVLLAAEDEDGHRAVVRGGTPKPAGKRAAPIAALRTQLYKTAGTPYVCGGVETQADNGVTLSVSDITALRRTVLDKLSALRAQPPRPEEGEFHPGVRYLTRKEPPVLTLQVMSAEQLSADLAVLRPAILYAPLREILSHPHAFAPFERCSVPVCPVLPRVTGDHELAALKKDLRRAYEIGLREVLSGDFGLLEIARAKGFQVRGDFGLQIANSQTLKECKRMGLLSAALSVFMSLGQLKELSHGMDTELFAYGRLPLLLSEECLIRRCSGMHNCDNPNVLTEGGAHYPMLREEGCRTGLYDARKVFIADRLPELEQAGLWGLRLFFTTENAKECFQVAQRYKELGLYEPLNVTKGWLFAD